MGVLSNIFSNVTGGIWAIVSAALILVVAVVASSIVKNLF